MLSAPTRTAPAASRRSISVASRAAGGASRLIFEPASVGNPAMSNRFFTANGTPASGGERLAAGARLVERLRTRKRTPLGERGERIEQRIARTDTGERGLHDSPARWCGRCRRRRRFRRLTSSRIRSSPFQAWKTGAGSVSSPSGNSSTSAACVKIKRRLNRIPPCQAGSSGSASAWALAAIRLSKASGFLARNGRGVVFRAVFVLRAAGLRVHAGKALKITSKSLILRHCCTHSEGRQGAARGAHKRSWGGLSAQ